MTPPVLLPAAGRAARPWRNGGGLAADVAAWPARASDNGFAVRIAIATIEHACDFSFFPGVDRVLLVLRGTLDLTGVNEVPAQLDAASDAIVFAGELAVHAAPAAGNGTVTVLNVMTRRPAAPAAVERIGSAPRLEPGPCCLVAAAAATIGINGEELALAAFDAVLCAAGTTVAAPPATLVLARLGAGASTAP